MFTLDNKKKIYCKKFFKSIGSSYKKYKNIYYLNNDGYIENLLFDSCKVIDITANIKQYYLFD